MVFSSISALDEHRSEWQFFLQKWVNWTDDLNVLWLGMTRLCIYYYEGLSCGPDKFGLYRALIFYKNVVPPVGLLVLSPGRETKFDEPIKVFLPGFFLSFEAWLNKKGKKLPPFSFWRINPTPPPLLFDIFSFSGVSHEGFCCLAAVFITFLFQQELDRSLQ